MARLGARLNVAELQDANPNKPHFERCDLKTHLCKLVVAGIIKNIELYDNLVVSQFETHN